MDGHGGKGIGQEHKYTCENAELDIAPVDKLELVTEDYGKYHGGCTESYGIHMERRYPADIGKAGETAAPDESDHYEGDDRQSGMLHSRLAVDGFA